MADPARPSSIAGERDLARRGAGWNTGHARTARRSPPRRPHQTGRHDLLTRSRPRADQVVQQRLGVGRDEQARAGLRAQEALGRPRGRGTRRGRRSSRGVDQRRAACRGCRAGSRCRPRSAPRACRSRPGRATNASLSSAISALRSCIDVDDVQLGQAAGARSRGPRARCGITPIDLAAGARAPCRPARPSGRRTRRRRRPRRSRSARATRELPASPPRRRGSAPKLDPQ